MIHEGRRWETARAVEIGLTTTAWTHLSSRTWRTNVSNTVRLLVLCASCLWCCSTRSRYLLRSYDPANLGRRTSPTRTTMIRWNERRSAEEETHREEWKIVEEYATFVVLFRNRRGHLRNESATLMLVVLVAFGITPYERVVLLFWVWIIVVYSEMVDGRIAIVIKWWTTVVVAGTRRRIDRPSQVVALVI